MDVHVPDVMPFTPHRRSYLQTLRRHPGRLRAWYADYDNRTAGFRVVGKGQSLRIECRIPGADCNPLSGIRRISRYRYGWHPEPDRTSGMFYRGYLRVPNICPRTLYLEEATDQFENNGFAKQAFRRKSGARTTATFQKKNIEAYHRAVTDWERKRYFERI